MWVFCYFLPSQLALTQVYEILASTLLGNNGENSARIMLGSGYVMIHTCFHSCMLAFEGSKSQV